MAKQYQYESPHAWLKAWSERFFEDNSQEDMEANLRVLAHALNDLATQVDADTIQNLFQDEMSEDNYFGDHNHRVVVGNVGTIYDGPDEAEARRLYAEYVAQSESGVGRAGNEPVFLFEGDDVKESHELDVVEEGDDVP